MKVELKMKNFGNNQQKKVTSLKQKDQHRSQIMEWTQVKTINKIQESKSIIIINFK